MPVPLFAVPYAAPRAIGGREGEGGRERERERERVSEIDREGGESTHS